MANTTPTQIIAGDTLQIDYSSSTYTNAAGYLVYLKLRGAADIDLTSSAIDDTTFRISATAAATAAYTAGFYNYVVYVSDGTNQYTLEQGTVEIKQRFDLSTSPVTTSTHARTVLAAVEAVIEGRATKDQESYSIAGRSLSRTPISDLLTLRDYYKERVMKETIKKNKMIFRM